MDREKLDINIVRPKGCPDDVWAHVVEKHERDLAYKLFQKIGSGDYFSVRVNREELGNWDDFALRLSIACWIGKINVYEYKYPQLRVYGWRERLKILFTGHE